MSLPAGFAASDVHPDAAPGVAAALRNARTIPLDRAVLLAGDFNSLDIGDFPTKENIRRVVLASSTSVLLMGSAVQPN